MIWSLVLVLVMVGQWAFLKWGWINDLVRVFLLFVSLNEFLDTNLYNRLSSGLEGQELIYYDVPLCHRIALCLCSLSTSFRRYCYILTIIELNERGKDLLCKFLSFNLIATRSTVFTIILYLVKGLYVISGIIKLQEKIALLWIGASINNNETS